MMTLSTDHLRAHSPNIHRSCWSWDVAHVATTCISRKKHRPWHRKILSAKVKLGSSLSFCQTLLIFSFSQIPLRKITDLSIVVATSKNFRRATNTFLFEWVRISQPKHFSPDIGYLYRDDSTDLFTRIHKKKNTREVAHSAHLTYPYIISLLPGCVAASVILRFTTKLLGNGSRFFRAYKVCNQKKVTSCF